MNSYTVYVCVYKMGTKTQWTLLIKGSIISLLLYHLISHTILIFCEYKQIVQIEVVQQLIEMDSFNRLLVLPANIL